MKYDSVPILEIALNIQVNTDETCSRMVQTVLEVLLFQRSQIPFCYNVFKSIVRKISGHTRESDQLTEWSNYRLTKQRATVQEAAETIELLFKQLSEAVQKSKAGLQFMILFGSTVFTAKEAFLINVPEVNKHHYPQYHRHSMETILKQVAMKITVAEELHDKPKVTGPTNTFLLMGLNSDSSAQLLSEEHENWQLINEYKLPVNCKQYVINLSNQTGPRYCETVT
ncbi:uncharacterized protein LOC128737208 isoform X2 [Sabethes cyaneus]|uniref:uncharacterized protein LOC128737208 isoform X2 n=1 Tax=Sabethes cyaneus TaxID=53552 RepID=UPI00237E072A|nr:uncharacterized protein LOC128737208 isoform X2 [Sabethes cyaneus]